MTKFEGERKKIKRVKKELRESIEKEVYRSLNFKGVAMIYPFKTSKMPRFMVGNAIIKWKDLRKIIKYYE